MATLKPKTSVPEAVSNRIAQSRYWVQPTVSDDF